MYRSQERFLILEELKSLFHFSFLKSLFFFIQVIILQLIASEHNKILMQAIILQPPLQKVDTTISQELHSYKQI